VVCTYNTTFFNGNHPIFAARNKREGVASYRTERTNEERKQVKRRSDERETGNDTGVTIKINYKPFKIYNYGKKQGSFQVSWKT
jgi:hypothetical protein